MNSPENRAKVAERTEALLARHRRAIHVHTDKLFIKLMITQWVAGILCAVFISPRTWEGASSGAHPHLWVALFLGGLITVIPVVIAVQQPGTALSRHSIALGQAFTSALLIHLSGGRIETHFHIFGSMAFLAFYRDWKVLVTASVVTAVDHFLRSLYWPESVFGVLLTSPWRWVEHAAWLLFENFFLVIACIRGQEELRSIAKHRAEVETTADKVANEVLLRTAELRASNASLKSEVEERMRAQEERDQLGAQLLSAQKLEAVGQLAAGIAHEINTPTQYVGDNTRVLQEAFDDLMPILRTARELCARAQDADSPCAITNALREQLEQADVDYLIDEVPHAIVQSLDGIERVTKIVRAMKEFSHPGSEDAVDVDINHALASTIAVATNEWKYVAEVETRFDGALPMVPCLPGELNQVFLNILVNAAHAIADQVADSGDLGTITVSTEQDEEHAIVRISDTGGGIPEDVQTRIFDPFFTTKEVGKGTGQGLAIARAVIVKKHGGILDFESTPGRGTEFRIRLPLRRPQAVAA
ncbi:MAG: ATP-binding protein [Planctomycetota bacterium]